MTASLNREKVAILKNGGYATFPVLVHKESGEIISLKTYTFPNKQAPWTSNTVWRVDDKYRHLTMGRIWIPFGRKSRVQKQLGLTEENRWFPAYAKIGVPDGAKATGLSGCANAIIRVYQGKE
jgi:hypothetical protein